MFRNKVVVRAETPFSPPTAPFLFRQIHLDLPSPASSSTLPLKIDSLCWKLSRTLPLACFPHSPAALFVVYHGSQSSVAREAVVVIQRELPIKKIEEEEELSSGSLSAKAVECGLKALLLNEGWRCVGENCFVFSSFSSGEEKRHLLAMNVSAQSDIDGSFVFLVSPDVVRFSRFEAAKLVCSKSWKYFNKGEEVALENCNFATSCSTLPSLFEGHVIGARKLLPAGEGMRFEEVWSIKHGLEVHNDYFIKIHFSHGVCTGTQWYPSTFVLQGAGFSPAPQSIRISESVQVLQSFMRIVEAWNFFSQGKLKIKSISSLTIGSNLLTWTKTATHCQSGMANVDGSSNKAVAVDNLFSIKDFRTPRLASNHDNIGNARESETPHSKVSSHVSILPISGTCDHVSVNSSSQGSLLRHHAPGIKISHSESVSVFKGIVTETARQGKNKVAKDSSGNVVGGAANRKCLSEIDTNCPREEKEDRKNRKRTYKKGKTDKSNTQNTKKNSQEKEAIKIPTRNMSSSKVEAAKIITQHMASPKEMAANVVTRKRASPREDKSIDVQKKVSKKDKARSDQSDITSKVIDHHERRRLELLTVVELKSFLVSKHAKVGGKKQDLIQRITALLC